MCHFHRKPPPHKSEIRSAVTDPTSDNQPHRHPLPTLCRFLRNCCWCNRFLVDCCVSSLLLLSSSCIDGPILTSLVPPPPLSLSMSTCASCARRLPFCCCRPAAAVLPLPSAADALLFLLRCWLTSLRRSLDDRRPSIRSALLLFWLSCVLSCASRSIRSCLHFGVLVVVDG